MTAQPDALRPLTDVALDRGVAPERRCLALHALGRLGVAAVHRDLVTLLDDPDPSVREEADEALCTLADEDLGYDPDLPSAERRTFADKWLRFFADRE
jgi:HEAT repeat protein